MGIWGDYGKRHFNISPLDEGIDDINAVFLAALRPEPFDKFIDKRNISRANAIDILSEVGYSNVVETRDINVTINSLYEHSHTDHWTGFYSRLDEVWVLCFTNPHDADVLRDQASLE